MIPNNILNENAGTWTKGEEVLPGYRTYYLNPEIISGAHGVIIGHHPQLPTHLTGHLIDELGRIMTREDGRLIGIVFVDNDNDVDALHALGYVEGEVV